MVDGPLTYFCYYPALQLEQYFPEASDMEPAKTLLTAAALTHGSGKAGASSTTTSSTDPWVAVYASEYAQLCLDILSAWMPDVLADGFRSTHEVR